MINRLGSNDRGLGRADFTLVLGGAGSQVVAGDFDGDGVDTLLAVPGAGWVAGEWDGDGREQLGRFDAGRARFELFASAAVRWHRSSSETPAGSRSEPNSASDPATVGGYGQSRTTAERIGCLYRAHP